MKIKLERAWNGKLDKYNHILEKYNPIYEEKDGDFFAVIEVTEIEVLFSLAKELGSDLVISHYRDGAVTIYDDYME